MKLRLWFFPLCFLSIFLLSTTTTELTPKPVGYAVSAKPEVSAPAKRKIGFFDRLLSKYFLKKYQKAEDTAKADKLAANSQTFGIIALSTLVVGLLVPFVILASLPLGIVAMVTGNTALKTGTKETGKAHTGKSLGLATVVAFGALFIVALVLVASFSGWN